MLWQRNGGLVTKGGTALSVSVMTPEILLLSNMALSFYLMGPIWAVEVDIFRSWKLVDRKDFPTVQAVHWRKLPYWIFAPLASALLRSIVLIWYNPEGSPRWAMWHLNSQMLSHLLTSVFWGRWQAKLSRDEQRPQSPYLAKILATHWIRTLLINA